MEKENVGIFSVELDTTINKYVIVYSEKGERIVLNGEDCTFYRYIDGEEYIKTHKTELDIVISNYKRALEDGEDYTLVDEEQLDNDDDETLENHDEKSNNDDENLENHDEQSNNDDENKDKKKKSGLFVKIISGILAFVITFMGGYFCGKNNSSSKRCDFECEECLSYQNSISPDKEDPDNIQSTVLTTEKFEEVTASFSKLYTDKNLNITTEDLVKFVSIVNIDKLVEDNPELASELFDSQVKEEYLNDAAKVIGLTYTYNRNVYQETGKTDGFIRISDAVVGEQKQVLQTVETYVDLIATFSNDAEQANLYITQLINELGDPSSSMSYLDDGVGFGMQVSIELIRSCIAKDVINKKNLDALTILTSSEEYISNIFATYAKCNQSYTKTRK